MSLEEYAIWQGRMNKERKRNEFERIKRRSISEYSIDQIIEILKKSYAIDEKFYIIKLLMTFCGMRISECLLIRIESVNLKERFLLTGIEEGSRMSNKNGSNPLYFFFPLEVSKIIEQYVKGLEKDSIWLFSGKNIYQRKSSYCRVVTKQKFEFHFKTQFFRRSLLIFMIDVNYTPLFIAEMLMNHAITSKIKIHHDRLKIEDRRKYYDKYLPKEYLKILDVIKTF